MLKMAAALKLALITFIIFNVKKASFTAANSVCYSFHGDEVQDVPDLRIISSLWIYKSQKGICLSHTRALSVLLILAGDVELCPGPKCFVCAKIIRKNQRSTDCCNCAKAEDWSITKLVAKFCYDILAGFDHLQQYILTLYCSMCCIKLG